MMENRKEEKIAFYNIRPTKKMNSDVLEQYKDLVGKLKFFELTLSGNFKWLLNEKSTDEDMQMFLDVIENIANKIDVSPTLLEE